MSALDHATLTITELIPDSGAVGMFGELTGLSTGDAISVLEQVGRRVDQHASTTDALIVGRKGLQAEGVAGLLRPAPGIELEIAPKFLGQQWGRWREDFITIAALTTYGHLLPREVIAARPGERGHLANLLGHAFVTLYRQNERRPLRAYRTRTWTEWAIDGEPDPESIALPDTDGFVQSRIVLDRDNSYSQVIERAAAQLLHDVTNRDVRRQLADVRAQLHVRDRQHHHVRTGQRLPNRHRHWQTLYDLAIHITGGYQADYGGRGPLPVPGFIVKTADAWEELIYRALHAGLGSATVTRHRLYELGSRGAAPLKVDPDYTVVIGDAPHLLDAKYRHRIGRKLQIERDDVYEALAFIEAAEVPHIILLYPRIASDALHPIGAVHEHDRVTIGGRHIVAADVEVRGISDVGAWPELTARLAEGIYGIWHAEV